VKKPYQPSTIAWILIVGLCLLCGSISAFLFEHFRKTDYREGRIGIAVFMGLFGVFLTAGSIRMWIQNKRTKED